MEEVFMSDNGIAENEALGAAQYTADSLILKSMKVPFISWSYKGSINSISENKYDGVILGKLK